MTLPGVRAVLLDVDGTLLDSNDQQARSWVEAFAEAGHDVPYAEVRSRIGKGSDKMVAEILGPQVPATRQKDLGERASSIFLERYLTETGPTNGSRQLLELLKGVNVRLVVASSASEKALASLLKQAGVADLIDVTSTSSDVEDSKPDPDLIHKALEKSNVQARDAVMLGDTPYDIQAAKAAGVRCVIVRCGGWWNDYSFEHASAIFDDPAHIVSAWSHLLSPYVPGLEP